MMVKAHGNCVPFWHAIFGSFGYFCVLYCKEEKMDFRTQTDQGSFGVRVSALVIQDGKIFLAKSPKEEYYTIGGAIHVGEKTEEALKREVREEIDIDVKIEKLAFVVENLFTLEDQDFHQIEFHYLVRPLSEPNRQMEEGGQTRDCQWVALDDLAAINLNPAFLKEALLKQDGPIQHFINKD